MNYKKLEDLKNASIDILKGLKKLEALNTINDFTTNYKKIDLPFSQSLDEVVYKWDEFIDNIDQLIYDRRLKND